MTMEDIKTVIYDFLDRYEDFSKDDIENQYTKVYRPGWHPHPMQFWFNPPFDKNGESFPTLSGTIVLLNDGEIMVENAKTGLFFNLDECLGDSIENFVFSIQRNSPEESL